MRLYQLFAFTLALAVLAIMASAQQSDSCPDTLPSRLVAGGFAKVLPGGTNNIRLEPTISGAAVGSIPSGSTFEVIRGPVCADGFAWWEVNYEGLIGWTAEGSGDTYWTEPMSSSAESPPDAFQVVDSPDGMLQAIVTVVPCNENDEAVEFLDVVDTVTGDSQRVIRQDIICGGLGASGLAVLQWSESGSYLYYTDSREGNPDGLGIGWQPFLFQVRLSDMTITPLGNAKFSPDHEWVFGWDYREVRVTPTDANDITVFSMEPPSGDFRRVTDVIWLPDSSGILYIQADERISYAEQPYDPTSVTYVDITTLTQTVLIGSGD